MTEQFAHSGDLGDIIYSLPAIRAKGGGSLSLFNVPGKTTHPMTLEKANRLAPLLESQPYITSVIFDQECRDHSINGFRDHCPNRNLADRHLATQGLSWAYREEPWIDVLPKKVEPVIIHRSTRYPGNFPWKRLLETYKGMVGFVGTKEEHSIFQEKFGIVPFIEASDLLILASIIAGAKLYAGNQSCPLAIAQAIKANVMIEVCSKCRNDCIFQRVGETVIWNQRVEFPYV